MNKFKPRLYEENDEDTEKNPLDTLNDWDYEWLPEDGYGEEE